MTGLYITSTNIVYCTIGGVCVLQEPLLVSAADYVRNNGVFRLGAMMESTARSSPCINGSTLNAHFSLLARTSWRCFPFEPSDIELLIQQQPRIDHMRMSSFVIKAIGVDPQVIDMLADVLPRADACVGDVVANSIIATQSIATSSHDHPARVDDVLTATEHAKLGARRMDSLATPLAGGNVLHRYSPETMLQTLEFKSKLRPSVSVNDALVAASPFFFGSEASQVMDIRNVSLPSDARLREATVRLELLSLLFERVEAKLYETWRYLNPDSSPQLGYDWLVTREDAWSFSKESFMGPEDIVGADLNEAYTSRTLTLSTLGRGRSSVVKKSFNISTLHKLKAGSAAEYDALRYNVYGMLSDMGTEKGCADTGTLASPLVGVGDAQYRVADTMMYPNCLFMPEHLHIIFNALQNSIQKLVGGDMFIKKLRTLQTFLADKSLRRLFIALILNDHPDRFRFYNYSSVSIDWRWETLSTALEHLCPLLDLLKQHFDLEKMMTNKEGKSEARLLQGVSDILRGEHNLPELSNVVLLVGKQLELCAHRLEGCECHAGVWLSRTSHKRKQRVMKSTTGHADCFMKTRQACWFQADGLRGLCVDLQRCTSDVLQQRLSALPFAERALVVRIHLELCESVSEELADKFAFHDRLPYSVIKIYLGEIYPDRLGEAKQACAACLDEYDKVVACGKGALLHRVAQRLLKPGTECRRQLQAFAQSEFPLKGYPVAWMFVLQYNLVPVVGRRVEAAHAQIKRIGLMAKNSTPPFVASELGKMQHLEKLKLNHSFHTYCCQKWSSPTILDDLLKLVIPRGELKLMSKADKLQSVFQCSVEAEYRDMQLERDANAQWLVETAHTRKAGPRDMSLSWRTCVSYLKGKMERCSVHSLPLPLFEKALVCPSECDLKNIDPCSDVLGAASVHQEHEPFNIAAVDDVVFFEVLNAHPERRSHVPIHYQDTFTDAVHISRRRVLCSDSALSRVVLVSEADQLDTLHLRVLVDGIADSLRSWHTWKLISHGCAETGRRRPLGNVAASAADNSSVMLPIAANVLVSPLATSPSSSSSGALALPMLGDVASVRILESLSILQAEQPESDGVPFNAMIGTHIEEVRALEHVGALSVTEDEFGCSIVATSPSMTKYINVALVGNPTRFMDGKVCVNSKLDLVIHLLVQGWVPHAKPAIHNVGSGENRFVSSFARPLSYFACLYLLDELSVKGVKQLPHFEKDLYYQCVLRLRGAQLTEFRNHGQFDTAWCRRAVRDAELTMQIQDAPAPEEDFDACPDEMDNQFALVPALIPAIHDRVAFRRVLVVGDGGSVRVYVDHFSGGGSQRTWVNCTSKDHVNCFQWRQCSDFESPLELASYMYAWALSYEGYNCRETHMPYRPGTSVIESMGPLELRDF